MKKMTEDLGHHQLQAVNDDLHNHFYGKLGFKDASNLVLKTKML